jgi:hypothetical protein
VGKEAPQYILSAEMMKKLNLIKEQECRNSGVKYSAKNMLFTTEIS